MTGATTATPAGGMITIAGGSRQPGPKSYALIASQRHHRIGKRSGGAATFRHSRPQHRIIAVLTHVQQRFFVQFPGKIVLSSQQQNSVSLNRSLTG